jgi:lysophospholipase L1-like esterase
MRDGQRNHGWQRLVGAVCSGLLATLIAACDSGSDPSLAQPSTSTDTGEVSRVIAIGDSQTVGAWLDDPATESWPARLDDLLCPGTTCVTNIAVGGQPIGTASSTGPPPLLDALDAQLASIEQADTAVVLIGQLDLVSNDDTDQIVQWYGELEQRLASFGIDEVFFLTLLPFDTESHPNPEWIPQLEARRSAINAELRTRWGQAQHVVDLDGMLTEEGSAEFRPELSIKDGNHLSAQGSAIVATEVERQLRATQ